MSVEMLKLLVRQSFDSHVKVENLVDEWMYERFLAGKKYNIEKAHEALVDTIKWRVKNLSAYCSSEEVKETGILRFHGSDRENRPVCYFSGVIDRKSNCNFEQVIVRIIEQNYHLLEQKRQKICVVIDLKGTTVSNMNLSNIKVTVNTLQNHYPELLGVVLIINAPRIFHGIWEIVRKFLKQSVADKVVFCQDISLYIDPKLSKESLNKGNFLKKV